MHIRRCFTTLVNLDDELFSIAGFDGSRRLSSVEKYNPRSKKWTLLNSINLPRSDATSVVIAGKIYVIGGYAGDSLNSCEVYDPHTDTWQFIEPMNSKRSGASAIAIPSQNCIMVIGGYNGTERMNTTEFYDLTAHKWNYGESMSKSRSNAACCLLGNEIFVMGGYTGIDTVTETEKYDIVTRTWTFAGPMSLPKSAMKVCVLRNLPNTKDYIGGAQFRQPLCNTGEGGQQSGWSPDLDEVSQHMALQPVLREH